jgi:hypothetical protein
MCRVGPAHAFADVLNASNPIRLGEQVLQACAAFVFDHALISTCKLACSTSRSTRTRSNDFVLVIVLCGSLFRTSTAADDLTSACDSRCTRPHFAALPRLKDRSPRADR